MILIDFGPHHVSIMVVHAGVHLNLEKGLAQLKGDHGALGFPDHDINRQLKGRLRFPIV